MASNLITPPDVILHPDSIFIINMLNEDLANLIDYLKTVPDEHNVHLYHSDMSENLDYAIKLSTRIPHLLVNIRYYYAMDHDLIEVVKNREDTVYFGDSNCYPSVIDWFREKFKKID